MVNAKKYGEDCKKDWIFPMIFDILVPVHTYPDGNSANLATHCASIALHLGATVHAIVLDVEFPNVSSPLGNMLIDVPNLLSGAKSVCREHGIAVASAMEGEMKAAGLQLRTTHFESYPGAIGDYVSKLGRYHDAIVIGIRGDDVTAQATAETVLFGSGKATLLVPEDAQPKPFGHVMIAWDGSREATRAVADAREFLKRAERVTILSVTDEKELPSSDIGQKLADHLARHKIKADVAWAKNNGRPVAETLQEYAHEIDAGLLVMGAFAHSRMRDFVLGGATSGILKNLRVAALLSH